MKIPKVIKKIPFTQNFNAKITEFLYLFSKQLNKQMENTFHAASRKLLTTKIFLLNLICIYGVNFFFLFVDSWNTHKNLLAIGGRWVFINLKLFRQMLSTFIVWDSISLNSYKENSIEPQFIFGLTRTFQGPKTNIINIALEKCWSLFQCLEKIFFLLSTNPNFRFKTFFA